MKVANWRPYGENVRFLSNFFRRCFSSWGCNYLKQDNAKKWSLGLAEARSELTFWISIECTLNCTEYEYFRHNV